MRVEYNIKEKRILKSVVDEQIEVLKAREKEIEDLRAQLVLKEAEAAEAICLRAEVSQCKVVEKSLRDDIKALTGRNITLEKENSELDVKVTDLAALVKVREQEVADLDAQVTAIKLQSDNQADWVHDLETSSAGLQEKVTVWLLTYDMKLAIVKCLHSPDYPSALRVAISKAIKKGMQDGDERYTSGADPDTTTTLSTTYASASSIPPILTDDYVVVHADSQEGAVADVNPLPNVDDVELNIS
ncbi:hypothetical protein Tco_0945012 [Tanacetum coccineum]